MYIDKKYSIQYKTNTHKLNKSIKTNKHPIKGRDVKNWFAVVVGSTI